MQDDENPHQAKALDLSRVFELESHGPDTFVGESPDYSWGRIFGGLVVAQAAWAGTQSVREEHRLHSLHAYFILGGELGEPVRYEVDRVRNGRSFTTRRIVARQSAGAILTLACSFQKEEAGPETQSTPFPAKVPPPEDLPMHWDAGAERCDVRAPKTPPRSRAWARFSLPLGSDPRLHACALAYLSDVNAMGAVHASYPGENVNHETMMGASLDHAMWFHRSAPADEWVLLDMTGHGMIGSRGLTTGQMFTRGGSHIATIAQEGLLREHRRTRAGGSG